MLARHPSRHVGSLRPLAQRALSERAVPPGLHAATTAAPACRAKLSAAHVSYVQTLVCFRELLLPPVEATPGAPYACGSEFTQIPSKLSCKLFNVNSGASHLHWPAKARMKLLTDLKRASDPSRTSSSCRASWYFARTSSSSSHSSLGNLLASPIARTPSLDLLEVIEIYLEITLDSRRTRRTGVQAAPHNRSAAQL